MATVSTGGSVFGPTWAAPMTPLAADSRPNGVNQNEVRLVSYSKDVVIFRSTPEVEESGSSLYLSIDNIRQAASLLVWLGSPSRTFTITNKMVSRTIEEAEANYKYLSLLRAWRMPSQGAGTQTDGSDTAAPETLRLWGYDGNGEGQFLGIPVVIANLNISFLSDVDYITTSTGYQMPIILPINISLREAHTANDLTEKFNYSDYKAGRLEEWT